MLVNEYAFFYSLCLFVVLSIAIVELDFHGRFEGFGQVSNRFLRPEDDYHCYFKGYKKSNKQLTLEEAEDIAERLYQGMHTRWSDSIAPRLPDGRRMPNAMTVMQAGDERYFHSSVKGNFDYTTIHPQARVTLDSIASKTKNKGKYVEHRTGGNCGETHCIISYFQKHPSRKKLPVGTTFGTFGIPGGGPPAQILPACRWKGDRYGCSEFIYHAADKHHAKLRGHLPTTNGPYGQLMVEPKPEPWSKTASKIASKRRKSKSPVSTLDSLSQSDPKTPRKRKRCESPSNKFDSLSKISSKESGKRKEPRDSSSESKKWSEVNSKEMWCRNEKPESRFFETPYLLQSRRKVKCKRQNTASPSLSLVLRSKKTLKTLGKRERSSSPPPETRPLPKKSSRTSSTKKNLKSGTSSSKSASRSPSRASPSTRNKREKNKHLPSNLKFQPKARPSQRTRSSIKFQSRSKESGNSKSVQRAHHREREEMLKPIRNVDAKSTRRRFNSDTRSVADTRSNTPNEGPVSTMTPGKLSYMDPRTTKQIHRAMDEAQMEGITKAAAQQQGRSGPSKLPGHPKLIVDRTWKQHYAHKKQHYTYRKQHYAHRKQHYAHRGQDPQLRFGGILDTPPKNVGFMTYINRENFHDRSHIINGDARRMKDSSPSPASSMAYDALALSRDATHGKLSFIDIRERRPGYSYKTAKAKASQAPR